MDQREEPDIKVLLNEREAMKSKITEMSNALVPFADLANEFAANLTDDTPIRIGALQSGIHFRRLLGDFRRARSVIQE